MNFGIWISRKKGKINKRSNGFPLIGGVLAFMAAMSTGASEATDRWTTVWNDSFEGASLNENLGVAVSAQGSVTQTGGQLQMFLSGNGNVQRAKVTTLSGQDGQTMFNSAHLYDFTSHRVSVRFDIASFGGSPSTGANYNVFHTGIGELNAFAFVTNGLQVNLAKRNDGVSDFYRFELYGFGSNINPALNGLPTAFEFDVLRNRLAVRVEGTTFTATGSDTFSWTFNAGTAPSYHLMFGAYNAGVPVTGTQVSLDSFRVKLRERMTIGLFAIGD